MGRRTRGYNPSNHGWRSTLVWARESFHRRPVLRFLQFPDEWVDYRRGGNYNGYRRRRIHVELSARFLLWEPQIGSLQQQSKRVGRRRQRHYSPHHERRSKLGVSKLRDFDLIKLDLGVRLANGMDGWHEQHNSENRYRRRSDESHSGENRGPYHVFTRTKLSESV